MRCSLLLKFRYIAFAYWTHLFKVILFVYNINFKIKVYFLTIKFEFKTRTQMVQWQSCGIVIWRTMVQIPHEAYWKKWFTFSIIFTIILLYFIEIKTQYCSSEKLNIFFPSATRRIRTGDLQGGVNVFRSQTSKCSPRYHSTVCKWLEHNILMQHMDCEILEAGPASIHPLSCSVYDYLLIECERGR